MDEANSYEEQRRRQMEQNKRKLDELRVHKLSAAVRQAAAKPMPVRSTLLPRDKTSCLLRSLVALLAPSGSPGAADQADDAAEYEPGRADRRSGLIASLPQRPDYRIRKANGDVRTELPDPVPVYATDEARAYAVTKAEQLKDQLGSDHPTFIKPMSHGLSTKWGHLNIPVHFSQYLPVHDEMMVLVDEVNKEFEMFYHVSYQGKYRLTGWRRFSAYHKLVDGDCLEFQLIERSKFKVYIVRASSCNKNDH